MRISVGGRVGRSRPRLARMSTFMSVTEVNQAVHAGKGYTVLASIWEKDSEGGYLSYRSQHIPTAQFCDPSAALTGLPGSAGGRNPLPALSDVQRSLEFWGVRNGRPVIVYDQGHGLFAARAWWILRWAGLTDVRIMDGGLAAWEAAGFDVVGGPGNISMESNAVAVEGSMRVATLDDVKKHTGPLVDTRQPNRYAGKRERFDLKAGHIPGAVNVPVEELFNEDRTVKTPSEILERFAAEGINSAQNMIIYSGSGNHSALAIAAMESAGLSGAAHYVGGWSQWSADKHNPVERSE